VQLCTGAVNFQAAAIGRCLPLIVKHLVFLRGVFPMKVKVLAASLAAIACVSIAQADGYDWHGAYVGLNGGYADVSSGTSRDVTVLGGYVAQDALDIEAASTIGQDPGGFTGGIQVGYNNVSSGFLFGIEADFSVVDASENDSVTVPWTIPYPGTLTTTVETEQEWLATVRARVGTVAGGNLLYVTGGAAFAEVNFTQGFSETTFPVPFGSLAASETRVGWTAGAGFEIPVGTNLTLKGEYLYVDLGSVDTVGTLGVVSSYNGSAEVTNSVYRVGFNIKL
jgi:outer membrane immunogenic protein